jgi:hypothetical protein
LGKFIHAYFSGSIKVAKPKSQRNSFLLLFSQATRFAEALETLRRKEMQSLLKAIAFREFDQSLLSPIIHIFSLMLYFELFFMTKKGERGFLFDELMAFFQRF